jgi:hypothetical protein
MKRWLAHAIFGIILVVSLTTRERASDALKESDNLEKAVIRPAQSQDLVFREFAAIADTDIRTILFDARDCERPVSIALLLVTFEQEPLMRLFNAPANIRRYLYLDRSWSEPHYLAMFLERAKYAILAAFGMTAYVPSKIMLLIDSPPDCHVADTIDWPTVWNRDYLSSTGRPGSGAH